MDMEYSLKEILSKTSEIQAKLNYALTQVEKLDVPPDLLWYLRDKVYQFYRPELARLDIASQVAQWWQDREKLVSKTEMD